MEQEFILIADEAHNMGAKNIKAAMNNSLIKKRIGLSATPKRIYDPEGTEFIDTFFNDKEPYTYSFSMKEAMDNDFLCNYKYYPVIVELNEDELEEYIEISKKLLKFFDFEKGVFKNDPIVEILLSPKLPFVRNNFNSFNNFNVVFN